MENSTINTTASDETQGQSLNEKHKVQYQTLQVECRNGVEGVATFSYNQMPFLGLTTDVMDWLTRNGFITWAMKGNGHIVTIVKR